MAVDSGWGVCVCLGRGAGSVQSITLDEADTYFWFVRNSDVFYPFPNNHVLNTLLMWVTTHAFGLSTLTARMPALLGAAIYIAAGYFLCPRITDRFSLQFSLFVCLILNPFILDFIVAARGYSLADAFLMTAIAIAVWDRSSLWRRWRWGCRSARIFRSRLWILRRCSRPRVGSASGIQLASGCGVRAAGIGCCAHDRRVHFHAHEKSRPVLRGAFAGRDGAGAGGRYALSNQSAIWRVVVQGDAVLEASDVARAGDFVRCEIAVSGGSEGSRRALPGSRGLRCCCTGSRSTYSNCLCR